MRKENKFKDVKKSNGKGSENKSSKYIWKSEYFSLFYKLKKICLQKLFKAMLDTWQLMLVKNFDHKALIPNFCGIGNKLLFSYWNLPDVKY